MKKNVRGVTGVFFFLQPWSPWKHCRFYEHQSLRARATITSGLAPTVRCYSQQGAENYMITLGNAYVDRPLQSNTPAKEHKISTLDQQGNFSNLSGRYLKTGSVYSLPYSAVLLCPIAWTVINCFQIITRFPYEYSRKHYKSLSWVQQTYTGLPL